MSLPQFSAPGVAHLHGSDYTQDEFEQEVQARSEDHLEQGMPLDEINNIFWNVARDVFCEWNECGLEDRTAMEFSRELSQQLKNGHTSMAQIQASGGMEPVHGITLEDWAGGNAKIVSGAALEDVLKVLGVERPQWDEAGAIWVARMSADTTFHISTAYGAAFTNNNIGRFANSNIGMAVQADSPQKAAAKASLPLYTEIFCAQSTAYSFGMDGAQYVKDTWGLTLGDWGEIGAHWSQLMRDDMDMMQEHGALMDNYNAHYKELFSAQQGGNAGDDIHF
jgi:hypothetical protein